jgi:hypothetical protein
MEPQDAREVLPDDEIALDPGPKGPISSSISSWLIYSYNGWLYQ